MIALTKRIDDPSGIGGQLLYVQQKFKTFS